MASSKGLLKVEHGCSIQNGIVAITVLACDDGGQVKGLWFEKKTFSSVMVVEAKVLFKACTIAKDQSYVKILIENGCKLVVHALLGYFTCP